MKSSGELHREYYSQFVTEGVKYSVLSQFTIEELVEQWKLGNAHLNSGVDYPTSKLSLDRWDCVSRGYLSYIARKAKEFGDTCGGSMSDGTCVVKEAAKQLIESYISVNP